MAVVQIIRCRLVPCDRCRYKHNIDRPKTQIHSVSMRRSTYLHNVNQDKFQDQGFAEIIGECPDFIQQS
jgi:hypothetical protein